jgi:hypothetical protein
MHHISDMWQFILVNYVCSVYGRGRKLDRAVEMINAAQSLGLSLDEKAYMNLITYYGKAGIVLLLNSVLKGNKKLKKLWTLLTSQKKLHCSLIAILILFSSW